MSVTAADSPDASADKTDVILHLPAQPVLDSARNLNELLTHLLVSVALICYADCMWIESCEVKTTAYYSVSTKPGAGNLFRARAR